MPALVEAQGKQIIFVHAPKTGGTWLRAALKRADLLKDNVVGEGGRAHPSSAWLRERLPTAIQVCFVRNPYEWLRSIWCDGIKREWKGMDSCVKDFRECASPDFREFLGSYVKRYPGAVGRMFEQYTEYASHRPTFEGLPTAVISSLTGCGIKVSKESRTAIKETPKINASSPELKKKAMLGRTGRNLRCAVELAERDFLLKHGY